MPSCDRTHRNRWESTMEVFKFSKWHKRNKKKKMMKIKSPSKNLFKAEVVKVSSLKTTSKGS